MTTAMSAVQHRSKSEEVDGGGIKEDGDDETKNGGAIHFLTGHPARGREVPPTLPLPQLPAATFPSSSLRLIIRYQYMCFILHKFPLIRTLFHCPRQNCEQNKNYEHL